MTANAASSPSISSASVKRRSVTSAAHSLSRKKFRLKVSPRSSAKRTASATPAALRLVMVIDRCGG